MRSTNACGKVTIGKFKHFFVFPLTRPGGGRKYSFTRIDVPLSCFHVGAETASLVTDDDENNRRSKNKAAAGVPLSLINYPSFTITYPKRMTGFFSKAIAMLCL